MKQLAAITLLLLLSLSACYKEDYSPPCNQIITGVWYRIETPSSPVQYKFWDDSRFTQNDMPGKQWIWDKENSTITLYGNPNRKWKINEIEENKLLVIELPSDTFTIVCK